MKRAFKFGLAFVALTASSAPMSRVAHGYDLMSNDPHWSSESCTTDCAKTNYPIYQLCSAGTYPDPVDEFDQVVTADWSLWMWERQGTSTSRFYHETSTCSGNYDDGSDWWGWGITAESTSQFHFYPFDGSCQTGGNHLANNSCFYIYGYCYHLHRYASDIRINDHDNCWDDFTHDELSACFDLQNSQQAAFVHEVGHANGLDHFEAWPSAMHSQMGSSICNTGSGFRTQPYADDMQGVAVYNGRNWANKKEVGGMPFLQVSQGNYQKSEFGPTIYCSSQAVSAKWTSMNYYKDLNGPLYIRYAIVPGPATVATDQNATWVSPVWYVPSSKTFPGATYGWNNSITVDPSLTSSGYHRLWLRLDYYNQHSEIDEGNNWIPFDIMYGPC